MGYSVQAHLPHFKKMMVFVDGENLSIRYKELLASSTSLEPRSGVLEFSENLVWSPSTVSVHQHEVNRATYYAYITGDTSTINSVERIIRGTVFQKENTSSLPNTLTPCIFKKERRNQSNKGVDIQMTVDILSHSFNNSLDTVYLVAGDGDYLPIIKEVIRWGKQVHLAFFEGGNGLNKQLLNYVDKFIPLDDIYFQPKKGGDTP